MTGGMGYYAVKGSCRVKAECVIVGRGTYKTRQAVDRMKIKGIDIRRLYAEVRYLYP
ncbi:MAG TPA: hypothetical protein VEH06_02425 [Candidatus Bathyarchaeia archaeon]|nr:hypothetical protein [Candidatus Bathyarchaeia archaeon]